MEIARSCGCVKTYLNKTGLADAEIEKINARVEQVLEEAVQFAIESPNPSVEEFLAEITNS